MMSLMNAAEEIRFPVGDFVIDPVVTDEKRRRWIAEMPQAPANLRVALAGVGDDQLDTSFWIHFESPTLPRVTTIPSAE